MAESPRNARVSDPSAAREIRVFISSTFRDMMQERELLVKRVFPELRRICAQRFVTFTEVDLRWGITEEQAAEGEILPICLEEIRLSRPYFIGLLGERYGWIPQSVPPSVIVKEPWLQEHISHKTSITELEILHGALNNPQAATHAYFYFRDPCYLESLPGDERVEMVERNIPGEVRSFGRDEATRRTEERKARLAALKQRIRQSGLPLLENYPNPEALASAVREHFLALIDRLYPENATTNPLDQEALDQDSYAARKLLAFVPRPAHTSVLDAFASIESTGQGFVLTGEVGAGKTALLADWIKRWHESHQNDFIFVQYCGSTPDSASVSQLLHRLLSELKRSFALPDEVPLQPDKLREALSLWLEKTIGETRIVLVFDGLNEIEGEEPDRQLTWLPKFFLPHVRVLVSALPGPALDALCERGWVEHSLPPCSTEERGQMIDQYFQRYRKTLGVKLRDQLIAATGTANPLFLRTVLEELRQFGIFEQLPVKVAEYLTATKPESLFSLVLHRWQQDFDASCDLVRRTLCHLWAARQGLSEMEWRELLRTSEDALLRQVWSPLFLALEPHLILHTGLYAFGHSFLRRAVQDEFLPALADQRAAHHMLADYFESQPDGLRKARELPWQLQRSQEWERLKACLGNLLMFIYLAVPERKYELLGYWLAMGARYDMVSVYQHELERLDRRTEFESLRAELFRAVAVFLVAAGHHDGAESICRRALEIDERLLGSEHPDTAKDLNNLAMVLRAQGDYDSAASYLKRALAIQEKTLGPDHTDIAVTLANLGEVLGYCKANPKEAIPILRRALAIKEQTQGSSHPETAVYRNNLAMALYTAGYLLESEVLAKQALEIDERMRGLEYPDTARDLNNYAMQLQAKGDYEAAEPLYQRALAIREKLLGPLHPLTAQSLNNLGTLFYDREDYDNAESLHRRALAIREQVLGNDHIDTSISMNNLAITLLHQKDHIAAETLFRRSLEIKVQVLGPEHPDVALALNNLADIYQENGDAAFAESIYRRALEINERALGREHLNTAEVLHNLGSLLIGERKFGEAESCFRRSLSIREKSLGPQHEVTISSLNELAYVLQELGNPEAEPLFRRLLAHHQSAFGEKNPRVATLMNNLAMLLEDKGDFDGAEDLLRQASEIWKQLSDPDDSNVAVSLNNLAELLEDKGAYGEAEQLLHRVLSIRERALGLDHPDAAIYLNALGNLSRKKEDLQAAESFYRRALAACEKSPVLDNLNRAIYLKNIASLLSYRGDYYGAEELIDCARDIHESMYGLDHPETAADLNSLAELQWQKGDHPNALYNYRQALSIREKVLGPEHRDTAASLYGLGLLLNEMDDPDGAEPYLRRALAIDEKVNGPDHIDTAASLNTLGQCLYSKGDIVDAQNLFRRALDIYNRVYGIEHPDTATTLSNLGLAFASQGDYDRAQECCASALKTRERVLGYKHPDTAAGMLTLAQVLSLKGDREEARGLYRKALSVFQETLGPGHPYTCLARDSLKKLGG
jgi:tetratricopeptide (TPR) repeat protein